MFLSFWNAQTSAFYFLYNFVRHKYRKKQIVLIYFMKILRDMLHLFLYHSNLIWIIETDFKMYNESNWYQIKIGSIHSYVQYSILKFEFLYMSIIELSKLRSLMISDTLWMAVLINITWSSKYTWWSALCFELVVGSKQVSILRNFPNGCFNTQVSLSSSIVKFMKFAKSIKCVLNFSDFNSS